VVREPGAQGPRPEAWRPRPHRDRAPPRIPLRHGREDDRRGEWAGPRKRRLRDDRPTPARRTTKRPPIALRRTTARDGRPPARPSPDAGRAARRRSLARRRSRHRQDALRRGGPGRGARGGDEHVDGPLPGRRGHAGALALDPDRARGLARGPEQPCCASRREVPRRPDSPRGRGPRARVHERSLRGLLGGKTRPTSPTCPPPGTAARPGAHP
jgi:hypothetical protein